MEKKKKEKCGRMSLVHYFVFGMVIFLLISRIAPMPQLIEFSETERNALPNIYTAPAAWKPVLKDTISYDDDPSPEQVVRGIMAYFKQLVRKKHSDVRRAFTQADRDAVWTAYAPSHPVLDHKGLPVFDQPDVAALWCVDSFGNVLYRHAPEGTPVSWDVGHRWPLAHGGSNNVANLVPLHSDANRYLQSDLPLNLVDAREGRMLTGLSIPLVRRLRECGHVWGRVTPDKLDILGTWLTKPHVDDMESLRQKGMERFLQDVFDANASIRGVRQRKAEQDRARIMIQAALWLAPDDNPDTVVRELLAMKKPGIRPRFCAALLERKASVFPDVADYPALEGLTTLPVETCQMGANALAAYEIM